MGGDTSFPAAGMMRQESVRPRFLPLYFMGMGATKSKGGERMNRNGYRDHWDQRDQDQRNWRQGFSKRHKVPCQQCGGLLHARGNHHFSAAQVSYLLAKEQARLAHREADRAAAERYQSGQAGQDDVLGT